MSNEYLAVRVDGGDTVFRCNEKQAAELSKSEDFLVVDLVTKAVLNSDGTQSLVKTFEEFFNPENVVDPDQTD